MASWRGPDGRSVPSGRPIGRRTSRPGRTEDDPPIVATEAPPPHPGHLAERAQLVEQPGQVAGDSRRQDVALENRGRNREPGQLVDDLGQALEGGRAAERLPATPQRPPRRATRGGTWPGRPDRPARPRVAGEPANAGAAAAGPPGRTTRVRRHRGGTRRAAAIRPPAAARGRPRRPRSGVPSGGPGRASGTARGSGPSERAAHRGRRPTGPRKAAGTPTGGAIPTPSR